MRAKHKPSHIGAPFRLMPAAPARASGEALLTLFAWFRPAPHLLFHIELI